MNDSGTFSEVSTALSGHTPVSNDKTGLARAAVVILLRKKQQGIEVLFIERASREGDPWSGNIGFPGGMVEPGDITPRHAAERETLEEIGLDLASCDYLGRISDIVGAHLPIQVACYVYGLTGDIRLSPNPEVSEFFWVPIAELSVPDRHLEARVHFGGEEFVRPAIRLPQEDKPLLWGITYRLIMELLQILNGA
jgi:8-oxo-dGTP pyrophosphatase MutT (NUDIX family)